MALTLLIAHVTALVYSIKEKMYPQNETYPHPDDFFITEFKFFVPITIDLKKEKSINLPDLYNVNENFLKEVQRAYDEQFRPDVNSSRRECVFEDKEEVKRQLDYLTWCPILVTEKTIIIIDEQDSNGNYIELYIDYEKLKSFKK